MEESLTNVEIVDSTGKRVETNDDVHLVLLDGVVGDLPEVRLLVSVIEGRSRNIDSRSIGSGNAQSVDSDACERIDGRGIQERLVTLFQNGAAALTKSLAQIPLIWGRHGGTAKRCPPDRIVRPLLSEPASEVCTVGLECPPVDEFPIVAATLRPGDVVMDGLPVDGYRFDGEGTFVFEVPGITVFANPRPIILGSGFKVVIPGRNC